MKFMLLVTATLLLQGLFVPPASAQGRFQVESRDVLPQSSLVIYTLRDSQLSMCYTLFVLEPPPPPAPVPTSVEPGFQPPDKVAVARATRDEQLAALRVRVAARSQDERVGHAPADEMARRKIEEAFDATIRGVPMMTTLPWASLQPGLQTGGYQYQAEEIRRSTVDPTTDHTMNESNRLLESWLVQAAQAPRMAAAGPTPCKPGLVKNAKP